MTVDGSPPLGLDAISALLLPFWQLVIGAVVVVAVIVSIHRLTRRGRSRMTNALLLLGGAIVTLAIIGVLTSGN
ncbi:hypothetical protein ACN27F_27345 [Solwaraspora sp. WMMB335]|uniref:hypothetical protein n=1 Tax=Solwaraspora sp. WMMB335 TaxID=3404118 RepID=UPI003B947DB2